MWRILNRYYFEQNSHNARSDVTWSRRWARCTPSCCPRRTCCPRSLPGRSACPLSTAAGATRYNSLKHEHQETGELTQAWLLTIPDGAGVYQEAEWGAGGRGDHPLALLVIALVWKWETLGYRRNYSFHKIPLYPAKNIPPPSFLLIFYNVTQLFASLLA